MPRYIVISDQVRGLKDGDAFKPEGFGVAMRVAHSVPGSYVASVETSLSPDEAERLLETMKQRGQIREYREEIEGFVPLGTVYPMGEEGTIREHFPTVGVPRDSLVDIHVGIADTGTPPVAAQEGPLSEYEITSLDNAVDGQGHATAVASCTFARRLSFAQALPNGSGSETTIARAIQALADAGVDIINLSLGFPGLNPPRSQLIDSAVAYAQGKGIPCGAAAGNSGWTAHIGSPQAVCNYVWGATVLDGSRPAAFTSGGCNWDIETAALPGDDVGVAHLDGGYGLADGTSFSAPLGNSIAAAVQRTHGLDWRTTVEFLRARARAFPAPRLRGLVQVAPSDLEGSVEPPQPPPDGDWNQAVVDICNEVWRIADDAQREAENGNLWAGVNGLGPVKDYMDQIKALLPKVPEPGPEPEPEFVSPVSGGGVYGATKWLPGSTGCDIFLAEGFPVMAPADCQVKLVRGGTGIQGGAEIILATPDNAWAWRYRHVQAGNFQVGASVRKGTVVGVIRDRSLDLLGDTPFWAGPMPSKWQHLDLSVNRGTDQFPPTGGGGGNVDADEWLESIGYKGRKLARTPGPPDAGRAATLQYIPAAADWTYTELEVWLASHIVELVKTSGSASPR